MPLGGIGGPQTIYSVRVGGREIRGTGDTEIGYAMGYGIQNILAGIHLSSPIVTSVTWSN